MYVVNSGNSGKGVKNRQIYATERQQLRRVTWGLVPIRPGTDTEQKTSFVMCWPIRSIGTDLINRMAICLARRKTDWPCRQDCWWVFII